MAGWKAGSTKGVLDADPGLKTPGAYPLATVTYAAASVGQDAAARKDYATMLRYVAGPGQTTGIGPGLLPPGYAPLPAALRDQTLTAASELVTGVVPASPGGSGGGSDGASGGGSGLSGGSGGGPGGGTGTAGATAGGTAGATPSSSRSASPAALKNGSGGPSNGTPVAKTGITPGAVLGAVRWVLLIVLIAGIAASLGGPLLMRAGGIRGAGRSLIPARFRRSTA